MRLKHFDHDGRARFVTFCTHKRIPVLTNDIYRKSVIRAIESVRTEFGFTILGYVIMPEHIHLVIVPRIDTKVGEIVGEIKRLSAKEIHKILEQQSNNLLSKLLVSRNGIEKFALWQRLCYDHNCRSDSAVWEKVEYCHNNPVKRGLVGEPYQWKWSSFNSYAGKQGVPLAIDLEIIAE